MKISLRIILLVAVMQLASLLPAQEHPFISEFKLSEGDRWVTIDWTMITGSTCDGTVIERSENNVDFVPVGMIEGLCGDISRPTSYRFTDQDTPELATLYYRLELGVSGYSASHRIDLQRLRSMEHRFQPSPVSDQGELLLNVGSNAEVEIHFFDPLGREIHRIIGRGGRHPLNVHGWSAGMHFYRILVEGEAMDGKFMVE